MKPYGLFKILLKLSSYYWTAKTKQQIHSPFLFNLVTDCLKRPYKPKEEDIESLRQVLKGDQSELKFEDFGKEGKWTSRTIAQIAKSSLKPRKYAELIGKLANYYKVQDAIELGTSLGITSAYLARNIGGTLFTFEGGKAVAEQAQKNWDTLNISNIQLGIGPFCDSLTNLAVDQNIDLLFIDGHHQKAPTLAYFDQLLPYCNKDTVIIFDDIHWSADMESAWQDIKQHPQVTTSVDLFFIGIVFLKPELSKAHFQIRY